MLNKLKKNNKKGFTLVELIVVLVILAILAALLIPALTGYIDKAKKKQIIAEARQAVMAAQTLVDEAYAKEDVGTEITIGDGTANVKLADIESLAELGAGTVKSAETEPTKITNTGSDLYKIVVSELVYVNDGKQCTYTANPADGEEKYKVENATPSAP